MVRTDKYITAKDLAEWDDEYNLGLTKRSVKKGELVLKEGQPCDYSFFVLKGFMRIYYLDLNGKEITHWFAPENSMITSPLSFFKSEENILYFEALEDTELILITLEQFNSLIGRSKQLEGAFRNLYLDIAMFWSRSIMNLHTQTAEERYLNLIAEHPYLFQKTKLTHIASYLGITPQSLSRIRKNI